MTGTNVNFSNKSLYGLKGASIVRDSNEKKNYHTDCFFKVKSLIYLPSSMH